MLIVTAAVLIAALVVCGASLRAVNTAVDTALQLHHETLLAAQRRQSDLAVERMTQLAEFWEAKDPLLETLISHDAHITRLRRALSRLGVAVLRAWP